MVGVGLGVFGGGGGCRGDCAGLLLLGVVRLLGVGLDGVVGFVPAICAYVGLVVFECGRVLGEILVMVVWSFSVVCVCMGLVAVDCGCWCWVGAGELGGLGSGSDMSDRSERTSKRERDWMLLVVELWDAVVLLMVGWVGGLSVLFSLSSELVCEVAVVWVGSVGVVCSVSVWVWLLSSTSLLSVLGLSRLRRVMGSSSLLE